MQMPFSGNRFVDARIGFDFDIDPLAGSIHLKNKAIDSIFDFHIDSPENHPYTFRRLPQTECADFNPSQAIEEAFFPPTPENAG
jgi:hypothetical protein